MRGDWYQLSLIFLGVLVTAFFGVFLYREIFPEYRLYQDAYVELEQFRTSYTDSPPPPFEFGIKQIMIEKGQGAPPIIDRCTSCHVALQFSHFSPNKISTDVNGNLIYNAEGVPVQVPSEDYIWAKLDQKILELQKKGQTAEAGRLSALKSVEVGEHVYDMTKVLRAHPLIGRETRPFEYHPVDEYGCTVCHNGNGRGLTTQKAHGPIFDGQYEAEFTGPVPQFTEKDPDNDPPFARIFNHKPGHELLFQTTPLFVGALMQANCVQCHTSSGAALRAASRETAIVADRREAGYRAVEEAFSNELEAIVSLLEIRDYLRRTGYDQTLSYLKEKKSDLALVEKERVAAGSQLDFLQKQKNQEDALYSVEVGIAEKIGTEALRETLYSEWETSEKSEKVLRAFLDKSLENPGATGSLYTKLTALNKNSDEVVVMRNASTAIQQAVRDERTQHLFDSEIDVLTKNFHRGKELYIWQACYACHRIDGLARGGVGPELTAAGEKYPWFLKESMVWPQADLKTSTMPNFHLDHEELEDLTTFLLAQHGRGKSSSETDYKTQLLKWETGYKLPWEKPINPGKLHDLRYSMTVFATEGCAACHRMKGFESNVGYLVELHEKPDFETLYREKEWFKNLIPEEITGSELVKVLEEHASEIDTRIVAGVRADSLLEQLEKDYPELIESFNTPFKYARRAKNHFFQTLSLQSDVPENLVRVEGEHKKWNERVRRVLMMFVQEYGLGRLIGPRPNWSGIYRSDEWLIEHFRKPSRHTAKSIMPVMPFDDSKFYALTYMLDELAKRNRDEVRQIWEHRGFNPELAYQTHCSQCHGEFLHGNGPVSEWIYPIPKNLRNGDFLRNLTKENVMSSILHGVKGTPMPPWGEVAPDKPMADGIPVLTEHEAAQIVDWLFASLLGGTVIRSDKDVEKWRYSPEDALQELQQEGNQLSPGTPPEFLELEEIPPPKTSHRNFTEEELYLADATLSPLSEHSGLKAWDCMLGGASYLAQHSDLKDPAPKGRVSSLEEEGGDIPKEVKEVFSVYPNPVEGPEKYVYYIKKQYFTKENLLAGQHFFELNCSVCHGKEADGQGYRAGTMYDAKPRMLTNLHWIDTRDDLRLLRSIKYGVPGTSMTPWGDLTSSLQRMQLVMFIRSLSSEQEERDNLFDAIYETYDHADQLIDTARVQEYATVNMLNEKLENLKTKDEELIAKLEKGEGSPQEAISLYQQRLELSRQLKNHEQADQLLVDLKKLLKQEGQIYQNLGIVFVGKTVLGELFDTYLRLVKTDNARFSVEEGGLQLHFSDQKEEEMAELVKGLEQELDLRIQAIEKEIVVVQGKLPSKERGKQMEHLNEELKKLQGLRNGLLAGHEEGKRLRRQQYEVYQAYQAKLKQLKNTKNTHDEIQ